MISCGIIGSCFAILLTAMLACLLQKLAMKSRQAGAWITVLLIGAAGTTFLSPLLEDFIFTWPVCLFASFQMLVDRLALNRKTVSRRERWRSGIAFIILPALGLMSFLACRRLSPVFERVFFGGFVAAIPISMASRILFCERQWRWVWKAICVAASFTALVWSSVAFLYLGVH